MGTHPENQVKVMQEKYVDLVVSGTDRREAARVAGYSDKTELRCIEAKGSPVYNLLMEKFKEKGMDEDWLAERFKIGAEECLQDGSKDKSMMAHAQHLKYIANLMGYGKNDKPGVAIQINNNPGGNPGSEFVPTRELIEGLQTLIGLLETENRRDRSLGVHEGSVEVGDPEARSGVGEPSSSDEASGSGGQP